MRRVKLASADIDGAANIELKEFLSEFFEVKGDFVKILRGEKGKEKTVEIEGRPEEELEEAMESIPWPLSLFELVYLKTWI